MLNANDARQCVKAYREGYSRKRFQWLMRQAINNGHPADCTRVFARALAESES
jgi:hypothetical protein